MYISYLFNLYLSLIIMFFPTPLGFDITLREGYLLVEKLLTPSRVSATTIFGEVQRKPNRTL